MKKLIAVIALATLAFSCSSKKEGNMIVQGQIKGLKKGTLYLQKIKDTSLVTVDSTAVFGENTFTLTDQVDSPEMYYVTFDSNTQQQNLMFFGEPGTIKITDKVKNFGFKPEITGSKNQEVIDKFNETNHKFKMQRLDFIAKDIEAKAVKDDAKRKELEADYRKMVRRRFLYTTNFAIAHKDFEAAPYIALSELFDANISLSDTVYNSLSDKVKNSLYGKQLHKFVSDVKAKENK